MAYTTINKPTDYFNTKLYTGNGSTGNAQTGVGFQPDLTWIKNRSDANPHCWTDAVRGATKYIESDTTDAEDTNAQFLQSFNSDGFTVGSSGRVNTNGNNYASWNWKANGAGSANTDGSINSTVSANTTAGFSISKYVGNDTAGATVGHGLGAVPEMMIVKRLSGSAQHWSIYHKDIGNTHYLQFDTNAKLDDAGVWNDTSPTSTVFTIGNSSKVNGGGGSDSYIAYCFAEKTGYSKFGSYVGNGNADGTFIYTGFAPKFVLLKITSGSDGWWLVDDKQANPYPNPNVQMLVANTNAGDNTSVSPFIDIYSNGFKLKSTWSGVNGSGSTYIYMAFGQSLVGSNNVPTTAR